jgi:hypothetical protein
MRVRNRIHPGRQGMRGKRASWQTFPEISVIIAVVVSLLLFVLLLFLESYLPHPGWQGLNDKRASW